MGRGCLFKPCTLGEAMQALCTRFPENDPLLGNQNEGKEVGLLLSMYPPFFLGGGAPSVLKCTWPNACALFLSFIAPSSATFHKLRASGRHLGRLENRAQSRSMGQ